MLAFVAVFSLGETFVPAQTTDFAPWKEAKNAETIADRVQQMLRRDFRDVTGTARNELLAQTLSKLADIVSDSDVVPSTRYNAILAVGQLLASPNNPPDAYPDALPYLIETYQKADCPKYLQYGALLGIIRHALLGIAPDKQDEVIDLLLETVMSEPEAGRIEPAVWDWFRLTALDGLTALKTVGTDGKVVATLLLLIDRKSQELENRCSNQDMLTRRDWEQCRRTIELASKAAKTLGDLDYTLAKDVDAKMMADTFIRLTKAVCDIEQKISLELADQGETTLLERIVIDVKMCTQSVVWGIRSSFLTGKPKENSFYTSLKSENPAVKRLDAVLAEIISLATFLDEGDKAQRTVVLPNAAKAFKFDHSELRDALAKCSEALMKI
jgi:hypothetical protein